MSLIKQTIKEIKFDELSGFRTFGLIYKFLMKIMNLFEKSKVSYNIKILNLKNLRVTLFDKQI